MRSIARQFGGPSGPVGHLVSGLLARKNADFNCWLVGQLRRAVPAQATLTELGCGPGIAPRELLAAYPAACVVGVDRSSVVLTSARRRNARAIETGRLTLVAGESEQAAGYAPADLFLAAHLSPRRVRGLRLRRSGCRAPRARRFHTAGLLTAW